jgi:hypothetical protein
VCRRSLVSIFERGVFVNVFEDTGHDIIPRLIPIAKSSEVLVQVIRQFDTSRHTHLFLPSTIIIVLYLVSNLRLIIWARCQVGIRGSEIRREVNERGDNRGFSGATIPSADRIATPYQSRSCGVSRSPIPSGSRRRFLSIVASAVAALLFGADGIVMVAGSRLRPYVGEGSGTLPTAETSKKRVLRVYNPDL